MIRVSIFYPNKPDSRFDADYYIQTHMPMACRLLSSAIKAVWVDIGLTGQTPDAPPPFAAICEFTCDSAQAFAEAFLPAASELRGDIPNYTDIEPLIQFSEIRFSQ